jgi:protein gp37
MIFVNSMSDLFHKGVPAAFVDKVFETMEAADWHIFQVLTKRSSRMQTYLRDRYGAGRGPSHIWCGVSVEDRQATSRIAQALPPGCNSLRQASRQLPRHGPARLNAPVAAR